jgi:oligopeptide/dipeptide ABC transporter ATP-binding protein
MLWPAGTPLGWFMTEALLELRHLHKRFTIKGKGQLHAVDDVELSIAPGESVGLVGESGCGKSTLVRVITRLLDATEGEILFMGENLAGIAAQKFARHKKRADIQMVFQDPTDSLNPRYSAAQSIEEPLRLLAGKTAAQASERCLEVAGQVGLPVELLSRFPHQLSGGQKARVGIARALSVNPRLLILDEPTAALDVSVQAVVLQLLAQLRKQLGLSYLFVSHDLNVVRLLTDRVAVMYLGKIVETGPSQEVFNHPRHPYTQALISAIPGQGPRIKLEGEISSPIDPAPNACRFASRCPKAMPKCSTQMPRLQQVGASQVACLLATDAALN